MSTAVSRGLLLSIRFHDGRYHGAGDWPPSPARLFQALVAGAASGGALTDHDRDALTWLERLAPPVIAVPVARLARGYATFVPNNDLDSVDGNPNRIGEIRAAKMIRPRLFDASLPFLYAWRCSAEPAREDHARAICAISEKLYQLGRGVDMAWASGEVLDFAEIEARFMLYGGVVHRPGGEGGKVLACPQLGSFASLTQRFETLRRRFSREGKQQLFVQPPKARFASILYDSPPARLLFDLRSPDAQALFVPWRFTSIVALVERVRDSAAERLKKARPDQENEIERVFIGREAGEADKVARLRITPLPSIGHEHADRAIRRVLVEIPVDCPLREDDIAWSFSGLPVSTNTETGEFWSFLTAVVDEDMLRHFGTTEACRLWRTVTPAALPQTAARRRIDPARLRERVEQKGATERVQEETRAAAAVRQALRHTGIDSAVESIRVQREPFEGKGARAESFAPGTRFAKERLWHVEIRFQKPVGGPLIFGDGRYLGLGLCAPVRETCAIFVFALEGAKPVPGQEAVIAQAARRAVMARVQEQLGPGKSMPSFFSGHEPDGTPLRRGHHIHLFYAADFASDPARLLIIAPHIVERRNMAVDERKHLQLLERALIGFDALRAGKAGLFKLSVLAAPMEEGVIFGPARCWVSVTPYRPTRHLKRKDDVAETLIADILAESARRNLPRPEVEILSCKTGPRGGVCAKVRLTFAVEIAGPILLGLHAHEGSGSFRLEALSDIAR